MTITQYSPVEDDQVGAERGPKHKRTSSSGATPESGIPAWRAGLGHFDTVQRRTRKGRSTFVVTERRARRMRADVDSFTIDEDGHVQAVEREARLTGQTLALLADRWMVENAPDLVSEHHGGTAQCTCDDLSAESVTYGRTDRKPVWTGTGSTGYRTSELVVRRCHCGWQSLLGSDMGRSWQEMTPDPRRVTTFPQSADRNAARTAARKATRTVREAAQAAEAEKWADETAVITSALQEATEGDVVTLAWPGVTAAITFRTGSPMTVRMTRGDETLTFRSRTASAIARRVVA